MASCSREENADFQEFEKKWKEWRKCYSDDDNHSRYSSGGDVNSICNQISGMLWDAAVWNIINKSRTFASNNSDGSLQVNDMIHKLIDRCFFKSQMIAIRSLVYGKNLSGQKAAYSFSSLIKNMIKHSELITRGNILKTENLPDAMDLREKSLDKLCGVQENSRSPSDVVKKEWLVKAKSAVEKASRKINKYVNDFIAHSATPERRRETESVNVTLDELYNAQRQICNTATFIGRLLNGPVDYQRLPTPNYDQFEHIDLPLVDSKHVNDLRNEWQAFREKTAEWGNLGNEIIEDI